jgi:cell division protein FtsN
MRISLSSGAVVETVVTLAAALLMTVAGFEMLQDTLASSSPSIATGSPAVHVSVAPPQPRTVIALPHVDATLG